jgi:uncharacterized membrane protein
MLAPNQSTDYGEILKKTWNGFIQGDNIVPLLVGALLFGFGSALTLGLLAGPLALGFSTICLRIARGEHASLDDLKVGFWKRFGTSFLAGIIIEVTVAVGLLALFVPGVVLAFLFSYTFYVMASRPELSAVECIKESVRLAKVDIVDLVVAWMVGLILTSLLGPSIVGGVAAVAFTGLLFAIVFERAAAPSRSAPAPTGGVTSGVT